VNYILHFDLNHTPCGFDSTKIITRDLSKSDDGLDTKKKIRALSTITKYLKGNVIDNKFIPDKDGKIMYKSYLSDRYDEKTREKITQNILADYLHIS
jgi:hypothetical protein